MRCLKILLSIFWLSPLLVWANAIKISPVRLEFSDNKPMAILTVTNPSDEPLMLQSELVRWLQIDGEDDYQTSQDILVVPPLFTVMPHQSQVMRFVATLNQTETERAYRLFLREIIAKDESPTQGLRMALHISVPVFVSPKVKSQEQFHWQIVNQDGSHFVRLCNNGNITLLVNQIELLDESGKPLVDPKHVFKYLLPNQQYQWPITNFLLNPESHYQVKASINGKAVTHAPTVVS